MKAPVHISDLRKLTKWEQKQILKKLGPARADELMHTWTFFARPNQLPPNNTDWFCFMFLAGRGAGKALDVDTPIRCVDGWKRMGDVVAGDQVFDENGSPCRVVVAHTPFVSEEAYRITFADGEKIVACRDHLWVTHDALERKRLNRRGDVIPGDWADKPYLTTRDLFETQVYGKRGDRNHSIPLAKPLQTVPCHLPIDPYIFGVWLGDGHSAGAALTTMEPEIVEAMENAGYTPRRHQSTNNGLASTYGFGSKDDVRDQESGRMLSNGSVHSSLRALGVVKNKHIPWVYLNASVEDRLALFQGLIDSDGYVDKNLVEFTSCNRKLAEDFIELAAGLGEKPVLREGRATLNGRDCGPKYRVHFRAVNPPSRLPRKAAHWVAPEETKQALRNRHRMITSVVPVGVTHVRCLTVDSPNSMFLAGRSLTPTHNTRSGAEWVRDQVKRGKKRIALLAPTASDCRDTLVEGESGILAVCWEHDRDLKGNLVGKPKYEPSKRQLTWANGAIAKMYSAEEPERLRGPQFDAAWADELCAWSDDQGTWDMLMFGLRLGKHPQIFVSTTPKPRKLLKDIMGEETTLISTGSTYDNAENLAPSYLAKMKAKYEGTRLGQQELHAQLLTEAQGALWDNTLLDACRLDGEPPVDFLRIVVAIDPAISTNKTSDSTGIVVAALGTDDKVYVLKDVSGRYSPQEWATKAIDEFKLFGADRVVAEKNQGGDMVKYTLNTIEPNLPIRLVHASRGKAARAEPVSALYEQGKVCHVKGLIDLEEQMVEWEPLSGMASPDRLDALVWAVTELKLGGSTRPTMSLGYKDAKSIEREEELN
jgi:phage terminase large subunit-like protein